MGSATARPSLVRAGGAAVLLSLVVACATSTAPSQAPAAGGTTQAAQAGRTDVVPRRPIGTLTDAEMEMARVAWQYFENNYQPKSGFVNAADKYPSTTMWDLASAMAATVSARELGLITVPVFNERIAAALRSLGTLDLFHGELPNKAYHAITLQETTYTNEPGEIGFSAIDLGRLMTWLRIIRERYPEHLPLVDAVLLRWNFCNLLDQWGTMYGAAVSGDKRTQYLQEGRLGYEEYAAKGLELWGFDVTRAAKPEPFVYTPILGYQVPHDRRDPRELGAHNYVVSESYVLDGIEFNWDLADDVSSSHDVHTDRFMADHVDRIFLVQKARHRQTGIVTARTEHQLDEAPFFVYDTLYTDGAAWNTITEAGAVVPKYAAVASKAAIGLWGLFDDPYSDVLFERVRGLMVPGSGIQEGAYEDGRGPIKAFTANNNGIILEILAYRKLGKLLPNARTRGPWDQALQPKDCDRCRPRVKAAGAAR